MKKRFAHARILKIILGILIGVIALLCVGWLIIIAGSPKLDDYDAAPKGYRSTVLDQNGKILTTLSKQDSNRVYVSENEIPDVVKQAFISIEDERFYDHHGVDYTGILRAVFRGVKNGNLSEGASTITQQLIKNNVLTEWTSEDNFWQRLVRKVREQYLAGQLEKIHDKEWILNNYLNTINLGNGTWGVQAASRSYFGKDVSALTASEAAVLAAIPKSPSEYNPLKHPKANKKRRELVLDKMVSLGYLSEKECAEAKADNVYKRIRSQSSRSRNEDTLSWFEDALIDQLIPDLQQKLSISPEAAWELLYTGGLTIESTADKKMQKACEKAVLAHTDTDGPQSSLVLIDVQSGAVRALVGGSGRKTGSLLYNHATDSIRQPGSTLKIIGPYAAGLESGSLTLGTTIDDAPYAYSDGTSLKNASGTYGGMTTIRNAIAHSNNIVAVKCLQQLGIDTVFSTIEKFGITTLNEDDRVESLALGGTTNGVTNLELTAAYSAIARGGQYIQPVLYSRILDQDGSVLLESSPQTHTVIKSVNAALLTDAMRSVITDGTGTDAAVEGLDLAGKSGTTTDGRDAWFVGFSSELTCGVWGGYDDNQVQQDTSYVKTIWREAMKESHSNLSASSLSADRDSSLISVSICTKCGKLAVSGLCDRTVAGNMTATEYYVSGTQPTESCDCHVKIRSGGSDYFSFSQDYKVYLRSASAGTSDTAYVAPSDGSEYKEHWYDGLFGWDDESSDNQTNENNGSGGQNGYDSPDYPNGQDGRGSDRQNDYSDNPDGQDSGEQDDWNIFPDLRRGIEEFFFE